MTSTLRYSLPVGQLPPSKGAGFFLSEQFVRECPGNIVQGIHMLHTGYRKRTSGCQAAIAPGVRVFLAGGTDLGNRRCAAQKA